MNLHRRPERGEAPEYYFKYIDLVPGGDIRELLESQLAEMTAFFQHVPEARHGHRYAPGKWTVRDVVAHLADCERLFAFRAFWFARGFESELPSFDQNVAADGAHADARSFSDLVEELRALRAATLGLLRGLPADAWQRTGIASGCAFSVRALAFIMAGHVTYHLRLLRDRYL